MTTRRHSRTHKFPGLSDRQRERVLRRRFERYATASEAVFAQAELPEQVATAVTEEAVEEEPPFDLEELWHPAPLKPASGCLTAMALSVVMWLMMFTLFFWIV